MSSENKKEAQCLLAETSDSIRGIIAALDTWRQRTPERVDPVQVAQFACALSMALDGCQERLDKASALID